MAAGVKRQRTFLVLRGPIQVIKESSYPSNSSKRSFSNVYYTKKMSNNETVLRNWLVYSKSTDSDFCFYCKLFHDDISPFTGKIGYKDWQHLSIGLERHEKSLGHLECVKRQITLKTLVLEEKSVDFLHQIESERASRGIQFG